MQSDVIFKDTVQKNRWLQYILTEVSRFQQYETLCENAELVNNFLEEGLNI